MIVKLSSEFFVKVFFLCFFGSVYNSYFFLYASNITWIEEEESATFQTNICLRLQAPNSGVVIPNQVHADSGEWKQTAIL